MKTVEKGATYNPQGSFHIGVAAVDKELKSRKLKVYLREILPYSEGEMEATEVESKPKLEGDTTGGADEELKLKNYVECEYWDMATNRFWPPDVRKGEQVFVINLYDSDQYYWMSMGRDDNYRRCERLRFSVSDTVEFTTEQDDDNTWFIEIDTLTAKKIVISTSKSDTENPEKYRYLFEIDAVKNTVTINDDDNNEIKLESDTPRIYLRNRDKSMVDINKENVVIEAPNDLVLNYGRQMVRNGPVCTDQTQQKDKTTVMKAKNLSIICEDSFTINAPSIGLNGDVAIPKTLVSGHIETTQLSTGKTHQYKDASIDIKKGKGEGGNTPHPAEDDKNNRTGVAWEDIREAICDIDAELERIDAIIGHGHDHSICEHADAARMPKIRGA